MQIQVVLDKLANSVSVNLPASTTASNTGQAIVCARLHGPPVKMIVPCCASMKPGSTCQCHNSQGTAMLFNIMPAS